MQLVNVKSPDQNLTVRFQSLHSSAGFSTLESTGRTGTQPDPATGALPVAVFTDAADGRVQLAETKTTQPAKPKILTSRSFF